MAREPNYGFNKHRKEQERKARQDAKLLEKQQRRAEQARTGDLDDAQPTNQADEHPPLPESPDEK